uniref:Sodium channel and clathrin linker 1 n=1 Tax=Latimeria chalumnae TaxID=7897 RepID=H3B0W2_LATCH
MTTPETDFLRDQVQRLNAILAQYQAGNLPGPSTIQKPAQVCHGEAHGEADLAAPWLTDRSLMAPLVVEYDKHLEEMNEQLRYYQTQMGEMKLKLEKVIKENERLYAELKEAIEKQLESLPPSAGLGVDTFTEEGVVKNLQEQIQLANREKEQALELWQTAAQELDQLQQVYQEQMTEAQIHTADTQHRKEQLVHFQRLTQQFQIANQKLESTNQQFLKTVTEQNLELDQLRQQLRQAKLDLRTATAKVDDMTKVMLNLQEEMQRKEEDEAAAQGREEASDRRLQQLQSAIAQLEIKLRVAAQDAEQLRRERAGFEKQIGEFQERCAELEEEKYEATVKVRDSIQLLEEANLQKDQALLRGKQKEDEIGKLKEAMTQLVQEAAIRTRKEVENVRKQCNMQISRLAEELSALQMECGDKQGQIERAIREKRAVEEELEKLYREGGGTEGDRRKMEELLQRCLNAERAKDDLQISLQTAQNRTKKLEMNYEEELSRCQEKIQKLQGVLESTRGDCNTVSEERLKLHQENEQLHKEMEEQRKITLEAQRKAKQQLSAMEQEYSMKEHCYEVRLRELEDTNRNSISELKRLLMAQQKTRSEWREETKKLTEAFNTQLNTLNSEVSRQKHHSQELVSQLEIATEKVAEYEKLMTEHQEKTSRLERRLAQAEHRAATASQQVIQHGLTIARPKVILLQNFKLENL